MCTNIKKLSFFFSTPPLLINVIVDDTNILHVALQSTAYILYLKTLIDVTCITNILTRGKYYM